MAETQPKLQPALLEIVSDDFPIRHRVGWLLAYYRVKMPVRKRRMLVIASFIRGRRSF
jgi:hypothetical protein